MKKNENMLILELCKVDNYNKDKIKQLLSENLDFPYILGQILINRVGGIAYHTLKNCDFLGKLNREFRNVLKEMYESNYKKSVSYREMLIELQNILKNANFKYAVLKGSYLVYIYDLGLRTSNDVDILISKKDISELSKLLKEHGFKQGHIRTGSFVEATRKEIVFSSMNRGETVPYIKKINMNNLEYCEVDINFSVDFKAYQENNLVENLLNNTSEFNVSKDSTLNILNKIDFVIHLCTHLYKEAKVINWVNMNRDISLYKFVDIYYIVNKNINSNYINGLIESINKYELNNECYYTFLYIKELFGIKDDNYELLLTKIKPQNTEYLNKIIDPTNKKLFQYDMPYVDWVFEWNRKGKIYEVEYENIY